MGTGMYRTSPDMRVSNRKRHLFLSSAVLLTLMFAAGCRGFFVNPKLSTITITPGTPTLSQGTSQTLTATGTFDDGSTKNVAGTVTWTSSDPSCATVSSTGLVTAATTVSTTCTTTITATSGTITATATVTVTPGTLVSISLTAQPTNPPANSIVQFTAKGTYSGSSQAQDITTQVGWVISDPSILSIPQGSGSGTVSSTATTGQSTQVNATLNGITSNTVTITVQ
jgi:trimeric autotransporter adhesin